MSINDFLNSPESLLHELVYLLDNHANTLLTKKFNLNFIHFKILIILYQHPEFNQKDLSKCMFFTESGISKTIATLKELKYLEAVENPENRREHLLKLTSSGKNIIEKAFKEFAKDTQKLFSSLNQQEAAVLNTSIKKLISQF